MPRCGLTNERLVQTAADMIEALGMKNFSMGALAACLHVKTASLYNHVESMDVLLAQVCAYALHMQYECEMQALEGVQGRDAIRALTCAYRRFAKAHWELYHLIINTAASCTEGLNDASGGLVEPFMRALAHTRLSEGQKMHWQRVLRSMVHGFVSQEKAGFFVHLPADAEESFQLAVQCCIDGLEQAEKRGE